MVLLRVTTTDSVIMTYLNEVTKRYWITSFIWLGTRCISSTNCKRCRLKSQTTQRDDGKTKWNDVTQQLTGNKPKVIFYQLIKARVAPDVTITRVTSSWDDRHEGRKLIAELIAQLVHNLSTYHRWPTTDHLLTLDNNCRRWRL